MAVYIMAPVIMHLAMPRRHTMPPRPSMSNRPAGSCANVTGTNMVASGVRAASASATDKAGRQRGVIVAASRSARQASYAGSDHRKNNLASWTLEHAARLSGLVAAESGDSQPKDSRPTPGKAAHSG